MSSKKSSSQKIDEAVSKSVNFEMTIADLAKRSERRAWLVAAIAIVVSLILLGGYFYMLPLKEKVPYVIMADAYTGTSSVARLTDDFMNRRITANEAINRSNVAHFVLARESYDLGTINLHDWVTVLTMASPNVANVYRNLVSPMNPDGPYKTYGKNEALRVKILSIVLSGGGPNLPPRGATVRFQRSLYNKTTGLSQPMGNKIATLTFTYKSDLQMDDQYRIENPLGFQVIDYRVDDDYDSPPPGEVQGAPVATAPQQSSNQAPTAPADQAMQPGGASSSSAGQQGSAPGNAYAPAPKTATNGVGNQ